MEYCIHPAGSTAYNLSVHGPILSLNSKKLSISQSALLDQGDAGQNCKHKSKILLPI